MLKHYNYVNFYFLLEEIRILYDFCPHCKESTPIQFLEEFTKAIDTSAYCLAHIFTHLDFDGGIAGYGWTRELCKPRRNTAYTTFLNHNVSDGYRISSYKTRGYYFFTRPSTAGINRGLVLLLKFHVKIRKP